MSDEAMSEAERVLTERATTCQVCGRALRVGEGVALIATKVDLDADRLTLATAHLGCIRDGARA